jgi:hypothetical protein
MNIMNEDYYKDNVVTFCEIEISYMSLLTFSLLILELCVNYSLAIQYFVL